MSAEVLRRAAAEMRRDAVAASGNVDDFLPAVADWLEVQAAEGWTGESIAVARAYLGSDA